MSGSAQSDFNSHTKTVVGFVVGLTGGLAACSRPGKILFMYLSARMKGIDFQGARKMVIVVRSDVRMSAGKVASQCAHAAVGCVVKCNEMHNKDLHPWIAQGQPKVVLQGPPGGELSLMQLYNQAEKKGLVVSLIKDAGRTQVRQGTCTALGIGPGPVSLIDKVTGHLKTY